MFPNLRCLQFCYCHMFQIRLVFLCISVRDVSRCEPTYKKRIWLVLNLHTGQTLICAIAKAAVLMHIHVVPLATSCVQTPLFNEERGSNTLICMMYIQNLRIEKHQRPCFIVLIDLFVQWCLVQCLVLSIFIYICAKTASEAISRI